MPLATEPEKIIVEVSEADSVTALLVQAAKPGRLGTTLILGHGAGADQMSSFMRLYAGGLAHRGFDVLTFNFIYKERGRGAPDPKARLEACYQAVITAARNHRKLKTNRVMIGGKSMGGRIASQVAAAGAGKLAGLVFLGYPLHPPGKPDQLRAAHLKDITAPMLFVQGSRDSFGTADELRTVISESRLNATLYLIEGGDHSFKAPKSLGLSQPEIYETTMDEIVRWAKTSLEYHSSQRKRMP
jgi:predicted alpha/beta-hydrolase family hydrolase